MNNQPTPWSETGFGSLHDHNGVQIIVWGLGLAHATRSPTSEANANFIRRAVNSHDALVSALKKARAELKPDGMQANWQILQAISIIDEALVAAEKP